MVLMMIRTHSPSPHLSDGFGSRFNDAISGNGGVCVCTSRTWIRTDERTNQMFRERERERECYSRIRRGRLWDVMAWRGIIKEPASLPRSIFRTHTGSRVVTSHALGYWLEIRQRIHKEPSPNRWHRSSEGSDLPVGCVAEWGRRRRRWVKNKLTSTLTARNDDHLLVTIFSQGQLLSLPLSSTPNLSPHTWCQQRQRASPQPLWSLTGSSSSRQSGQNCQLSRIQIMKEDRVWMPSRQQHVLILFILFPRPFSCIYNCISHPFSWKLMKNEISGSRIQQSDSNSRNEKWKRDTFLFLNSNCSLKHKSHLSSERHLPDSDSRISRW